MHLSARLSVLVPGEIPAGKVSVRQPAYCLEWNKIDVARYQSVIQKELRNLAAEAKAESGSVENRLENLSQLLQKQSSSTLEGD